MTCPGCGGLLAVTGRAHCPSGSACRWVCCSCGVVVDTASGRHYGIKPTKEAS